MVGPVGVLDRLDEVLVELGEFNTAQLDAKALAEFDRHLEQSRSRLGAVGLDTVAAVDQRGIWALDGAYSVSNWLAAQTGTSKADAGRRARIAGLVWQMPHTAAAYRAGEVTFDHVFVMSRCLGKRTLEAFTPDQEQVLLVAAKAMTADEFAEVVAAWIDRHDPEGAEPLTEGETDELFASRSLGGRVMGRFNLGSERGTVLLELLRKKVDEVYRRDQANAEIDATDRIDRRSPANRRAEALIDLLEQGAAAGTSGARIGPAFLILLDAMTFAGQAPDDPADELHQLADGTFVPRRLVEQWLCGSSAARLVLGVSGEVLSMGREARLATRAQRRALSARDRGCAVPGCDRPPSVCHAHHVVWWEDGGSTDIDSLCLLCTHHHRRVHTGKLIVKMDEGVPRFWNDLGAELRLRRRATVA